MTGFALAFSTLFSSQGASPEGSGDEKSPGKPGDRLPTDQSRRPALGRHLPVSGYRKEPSCGQTPPAPQRGLHGKDYTPGPNGASTADGPVRPISETRSRPLPGV